MVYQPGKKQITGNLTGNEQVVVDNGGAVVAYVTTGQIGSLAIGGGGNATLGNVTVTGASVLDGNVTIDGSIKVGNSTGATGNVNVGSTGNLVIVNGIIVGINA